MAPIFVSLDSYQAIKIVSFYNSRPCLTWSLLNSCRGFQHNSDLSWLGLKVLLPPKSKHIYLVVTANYDTSWSKWSFGLHIVFSSVLLYVCSEVCVQNIVILACTYHIKILYKTIYKILRIACKNQALVYKILLTVQLQYLNSMLNHQKHSDSLVNVSRTRTETKGNILCCKPKVL